MVGFLPLILGCGVETHIPAPGAERTLRLLALASVLERHQVEVFSSSWATTVQHNVVVFHDLTGL